MTSAPLASAHSAAAAQLSSSTGVSLSVFSVLARRYVAAKAGPISWPGREPPMHGQGGGAVAALAPVAAVAHVLVAVDEVVPVGDGHGREGLVARGCRSRSRRRRHHALSVQAEVVDGGHADLGQLADARSRSRGRRRPGRRRPPGLRCAAHPPAHVLVGPAAVAAHDVDAGPRRAAPPRRRTCSARGLHAHGVEPARPRGAPASPARPPRPRRRGRGARPRRWPSACRRAARAGPAHEERG